jgi:glycosyltransferase involved in cell wall biosynthesis
MGDRRIPLAIISNAKTPYRIALHERIADELPNLRLYSVFTHDESNAPWKLALPPRIRPVEFGVGEKSTGQGTLRNTLHEWHKGGRILDWMNAENIRAAVVLGYNDAGRLRLFHGCARRHIPCFLFGDSNVKADLAQGLKRQVKRAYLEQVLRLTSGVMTCGRLGREYFLRYGARADRLFPFPYEPDYGRILSLPDATIEAFRNKHSLVPGRRVLLFAGRLVELKGVADAVTAFCAIANRLPEWDFLLVGDGPLRTSLEAGIPLALRDRFRWTGFVNDPTELAAAFRAADLFVFPSHLEPWGVALCEAAAAGLALLASDVVGSAPEMIRDDVNGLTFPPRDVVALQDRLLRATAQLARYRSATPALFEAWRRANDPVQGLREALVSVGLTV